MFTHKYRYLFALLLSVYTYLNTEFCGVYEYFNIRIDGIIAFLTILSTSMLILVINKVIEPFIRKWVRPEKFKTHFPVVFFMAGSFLTTILTIAIVLIVGMLVYHYPAEQTIIPLKLNLTYAWLVNLLYH